MGEIITHDWWGGKGTLAQEAIQMMALQALLLVESITEPESYEKAEDNGGDSSS